MQYFHPESEHAIDTFVTRIFSDAESRPHFKKLIMDFAGGDEFGETLARMTDVVEKHFGTKSFENGFTHVTPHNGLALNGIYMSVWCSCTKPWNVDNPRPTDFIEVNIQKQLNFNPLVAERIPFPNWNEATRRDGIFKALIYGLQDERCLCSKLVKVPGNCDRCRLELNKEPCILCKSHVGRMHFKSLKRRQPKVHYHEMCKRRRFE